MRNDSCLLFIFQFWTDTQQQCMGWRMVGRIRSSCRCLHSNRFPDSRPSAFFTWYWALICEMADYRQLILICRVSCNSNGKDLRSPRQQPFPIVSKTAWNPTGLRAAYRQPHLYIVEFGWSQWGVSYIRLRCFFTETYWKRIQYKRKLRCHSDGFVFINFMEESFRSSFICFQG